MVLARTVLVMGKGGVGKTTVAHGLAGALAQRGLRTAVLELGTGASTHVAAPDTHESVAQLRISEETALSETAAEVFGSPRVAALVFGNFAVRQLVRVVPGVREYSLLVAARARLSTYDRIVVDMPATGHGISWLSAASQLAQLVPHGRARAQADALDRALRDPRETSYVLVTLPEQMVLAESAELEHALVTRLGVHVAHTVLNRVPAEADVRDDDARALAKLDPSTVAQLSELLAWARQRAAASKLARVLLASGRATLLFDTGTRPNSQTLQSALAFAAAGAV
jgi:anion-transporting  ArsA/GET3 family ATPase